MGYLKNGFEPKLLPSHDSFGLTKTCVQKKIKILCLCDYICMFKSEKAEDFEKKIDYPQLRLTTDVQKIWALHGVTMVHMYSVQNVLLCVAVVLEFVFFSGQTMVIMPTPIF